MKRSKTSRFLSAVLAILMVVTMFPVTAFAADEVYTKVTSSDELTSGKYVMVTDSGYAPTVLDGSWVLAETVTAGDSVVNPAKNLVWDITVDGTNVKLTDSNGVTIAPKGGNNNGIKGADYSWAVSFNNGTFVFAGQGSDTVYFAFNSDAQYLKFRGYKTSTVSGNPDAYPCNFTLYKLADAAEPETPVEPEAPKAPVSDGDKVVIYNPANMKALSSVYSGYYNSGVDVTLEGEKLLGYTDAEVWTVGANEDGTYTFSTADGKKLSLGASYSSMPLDDVNTAWKISEANTEGCYYIQNAVRGNYIEWYADKNNWSSYGSVNNEALFAQKIYVISENAEPEKPVEPEVPEEPVVPEGNVYELVSELKEGDVVVMYNEASGTLVSSTASGYKLAGVTASPEDGKIVTEDETVAWTVGKDGDNWTFTQGDKVLGMVQSGSYVNLSTKATDGFTAWTLENSTTENVFYLKNVNMPASNYGQYYLEYYSGWTAYASNNPSDKQFGITFYAIRSEEPAEPEVQYAEKMTELPQEGDVIVIYNSGFAMGAEASGKRLSAVEAAAEDGKIALAEGMAQLVVDVDDEGNYVFTVDGKYLTSAPTGNGLSFADELTDCGKWTFEEAVEGAWYIRNVGANYNGNYNQAMEYYNGFTTYGIKETEIYQMQLFLVSREAKGGKITSAADFVSGNYVMVVNTGFAMGSLDGTWVSAVEPVISGDKVVDAADGVWTLTVDGNSVIITDSNGVSIKPKGGNSNGISSGSYSWDWSFNEANGTFTFKGTGSDTVTLASNANMDATYGGFNRFRAYKNTTVSGNPATYPFEFTLYTVVEEVTESTLPKEGDRVVIYNFDAEGVLGAENDNQSIENVLPADYDAEYCPNLPYFDEMLGTETVGVGDGAVIFTVSRNDNYYRFYNETYGYLCSNGTGNNAFYTHEASEDADWLILEGKSGGYFLESRTAKFNGQYSQYLEYYSDCYKTYSMYNVTDYDIYEFGFYKIDEEFTTLVGDIVHSPYAEFVKENAFVGQDWTVEAVIKSRLEVGTYYVNVTDGFGEYREVLSEDHYTVTRNAGETVFRITIPAEMVKEILGFQINAGLDEGEVPGIGVEIDCEFAGVSNYGLTAGASVDICDEPGIGEITPAANSETGDEKRPVISAEIINAGDDATVTMTVNGETVDAVYDGEKVTYTPVSDMAEERVTVVVTVVRADGKEAVKAWSFYVGEAQYQLYFGQLHSHTTYSDGSGSLESALNYIKNLPDSANVDFVAFTDHSNYFDESGKANPEAALYDTSLMTAASQSLWSAYKEAVAEFNASQSDVVAIAGFEMTWSGGPGHMNTFNTEGVVSRNNTTLNNKTNDAGMKAYYALLSDVKGADSVNQFNHPGSTFGTFTDFAYWDALIDSRIQLVEVGNGEGQVGAGGYYPSYEYYTMALDKGWHVAPTNNQDNHKGKWGNANEARDVILTDNFTEEGIYDAIRAMRMYSTEDKNLEIGYTVNGLYLGSVIEEVPEKLNINVTVYDPDNSDSISKVEVIVNSGKVAYTWDDPTELAGGNLSAELDPTYSYYYIRVTEGDGDLAVTAPVWVGESLKLGISSVTTTTTTPVTNEALEITTTLFNSESAAANVKSVTYTTNGGVVVGTDMTGYEIPASGTVAFSFEFVPTAAKLTTVTVTAVVEIEGVEYVFNMDIELDVQDADKLVYVGIDASHYNEYVNGNYKDNMGNFSQLAAEYGVRTVTIYESEDLIAACSNPKYKALILTAPSRRSSEAQASDPLKVYTEEELAAIKAFNANGGIVILAGWSDHYENYPSVASIANMKAEEHMAATQNAVLEALGSSLRIGDDATYDDEYNGGQAYRLYFNSYNFDNFLVEGVEVDEENPHDRLYTEVFSHYGGASVYTVNGDIPSTVSPVVFGHSGTYSVDVDKDGLGGDSMPKYEYKDGDSRLMIMATEQIKGQGLIIVSGAAFMSNFEVQATIEDSGSEKNYSNYKVCENLLAYINPVKVTPIEEVRAQTEAGYKYTIEGIVTSNASGYDKDTAFFDCIYVQDATGGICCFPVAGNYKIGDVVRITGTTEYYQGEPELQVTSIEVVGEGLVLSKDVTAKQINDREVEGQLVTLKGKVESFELANGLVQTIMVKDAEGNVARVFIDGYITIGKDVENLEKGCDITVTGLASYDDTFNAPEGPFARIRVRNRADVVCTESADEPSKPSVPSKPAHEHEWSEWKVVNGVAVRECKDCGIVEKEYRVNTGKTEDEANPETGAPVNANAVSAFAGIAVLSAAVYVFGKRK